MSHEDRRSATLSQVCELERAPGGQIVLVLRDGARW